VLVAIVAVALQAVSLVKLVARNRELQGLDKVEEPPPPPRVRNTPPDIRQISILGERNSGTTWIFE